MRNHLYLSAALTLGLKVIFLPWLLHRLIRRLGRVLGYRVPAQSGRHHAGRVLIVIFAFGLAQPISALASTATRNSIGIAVAVILIAFLTMITRRKAMSQVVGFLSMENGLFFGAMSATYGMPMVVELGVALDVLVAMLVLGVFFFQIREQFDSLDLKHFESLKEEQYMEFLVLLGTPLLGALILGSVGGRRCGARSSMSPFRSSPSSRRARSPRESWPTAIWWSRASNFSSTRSMCSWSR